MNKKFKVGLIRVLTTEDEEVLQSHGKHIMEYFPELEVVTKCIPDQYEGIHSPELGEIALPKIVETARSFTDVDMIIVSCADDPGVAEIRKVLPDIPVTGGGETTVALALKYGSRIGVLGITDYAPQAYMRMIPDQMILGRQHTGSDDSGRKSKCTETGYEIKRTGCRSNCSCLHRTCNNRHCQRS